MTRFNRPPWKATRSTRPRDARPRVAMQDGLETLEAFFVPTPVDPTPEWTRAALLRLARDLRAQAAAVVKLARDMREDD